MSTAGSSISSTSTVQRGARGRERIGRARPVHGPRDGPPRDRRRPPRRRRRRRQRPRPIWASQSAPASCRRRARAAALRRRELRRLTGLHQPHVRARACPARLAPPAAPRRAPALHRSDRRDRDAAARGDDAAAAEWASSCSARPASTSAAAHSRLRRFRFRTGRRTWRPSRERGGAHAHATSRSSTRSRARGERPVPGLPGAQALASERRLSRLALLARKPTA